MQYEITLILLLPYAIFGAWIAINSLLTKEKLAWTTQHNSFQSQWIAWLRLARKHGNKERKGSVQSMWHGLVKRGHVSMQHARRNKQNNYNYNLNNYENYKRTSKRITLVMLPFSGWALQEHQTRKRGGKKASKRNMGQKSFRLFFLLLHALRHWARKGWSMSKQDNSLLPKLALGMTLFLALKFGTKVLAWWTKRNKKQGEILWNYTKHLRLVTLNTTQTS